MSNSLIPPAVAGTPDSAAAAVRRGAKAIVSSSSRVLLVRERHSDGRSFWTLPGGGVEPGEALVDGLRRELAEELGCSPAIGDAVSTFWYAHLGSSHTLSHYTAFSCSVPGDVRPVRSEGVLDSAWIAPDELPSDTLPQVRFLLRDGAHHPDVPSPER
jgi:8-oxo-dGTP diphosphatase